MAKSTGTPVAKDIANRHVYTIGADMTLADIVSFLQKHEISNAPVVEKRKHRSILVGFVSEGDCLEYLSNELFHGTPSPPQTARTIMKKHPVCVGPETNLFTLASILVNHSFRHLPVVEGDHLMGIVSRRDVLKAMDRYYRDSARRGQDERFPPDVKELIHHRFLVKGSDLE